MRQAVPHSLYFSQRHKHLSHSLGDTHTALACTKIGSMHKHSHTHMWCLIHSEREREKCRRKKTDGFWLLTFNDEFFSVTKQNKWSHLVEESEKTQTKLFLSLECPWNLSNFLDRKFDKTVLRCRWFKRLEQKDKYNVFVSFKTFSTQTWST